MKTKVVISLSIVAILILILIQLITVTKVYKLKKNEFDLTRQEYIGRAMFELESNYNTNGFDSVYFYMNNLSYDLSFYIDTMELDTEYPEFKDLIYRTFTDVLYDSEKASPFIKNYLDTNELDSDFKRAFIIRDLYIHSLDSIFNVINDNINNMIIEKEKEIGDAIKINLGSYEGDYFRIEIDYYLDYSHKQGIVYRDMVGILLFAIISILVVGFVFNYAYRNLMKEKKMSDLKTDFINNMTHELKTPLSTIAVASNSLAYENVISDKSKILDISRLIGKQNRHLNKLINHILDISMWEREQFKLDKKEVKLIPFLKEKAEAFRVKHSNGKINIIEDYQFRSLAIDLDEFQITTVIHNLLNNAVKYCIETPEIKISSYVDKELIISISDNGIGINQEEQKHIFDKFYRINRSDIHKIKGLGLGLYYVKKIIEAHKGHIEVKSKPGKGSTFTIFLPL